MDFCEFAASLVFRGSSRTMKDALRIPFSKNKKKIVTTKELMVGSDYYLLESKREHSGSEYLYKSKHC